MSDSARQALARVPSAAGDRVETVDARMLVLMRCVLAFSAFAIIWLDPSEPTRLVELTYASLAIYCVYSAGLAHASHKSGWPAPARALHWIDVAFFAALVSLTEGTSSIFFYFFFYSILVASFGWGFREGLSVTAASFALFTTVGLAFAPTGDRFELNRTMIRAVYLFVFGYMIAYLGGYEGLLKRRLRLLKDMNSLWNPRFGVDQAVGAHLDRLLDFYAADSCVLTLKLPADPPQFLMYQASLLKPGQSSIANAIVESTARPLLALPETVGALYHEPEGSWLRPTRRHVAFDFVKRAHSGDFEAESEALANLLDAKALLTVPYAQPDGTGGRLCVTSARQDFSRSDIEFLGQVSTAMAAALENIVLTEEHISRAAEQERVAISRDLHDTTIQPYIGLKLALEALQRDAEGGNPLSRRISELVEMAGMTVHDLRSYADRLRERAPMPGEVLAEAVRKHAARLGRFYGIAVAVASDVPARLDGRLAAEAFQIVSEGLSNVLRHTEAKTAFVSLRAENSTLLLQVGNEAPAPATEAQAFTPRSIDERSRALGGSATVERRADGYTVVQVSLPM